MTKFRFSTAGAIGALASALLMTALPAHADEQGRGRGNHGHRGGGGGESRGISPRQAAVARDDGNQGSARREIQGRAEVASPARVSAEAGRERGQDRQYRPSQGQDRQAWTGRQGTGATAQVTATARNTTYSAPRNASYGGDRSRSYGADGRTSGRASATTGQAWARSADRRQEARREEARNDRRNYTQGYRDGRRNDNRYGNDNRRWDNHGWRNDRRYNWQSYRNSNRGLYHLGRYYSPYRGYSYSRLSIGFRLGSLFYSNRYWINDPWQYRLPEVYGPYRWIRYYDDALLVDIYSGEVVDVINNFFW